MMVGRDFVLSELQARLDALEEGSLLQITRRDYERLFGENDVAKTRLRNFATSHACTASFADEAVLFRKTRRHLQDRSTTPEA